uniref:Putative ixodes 26 kDa salivary protein n=1 Tax=Ixodes ricinus TaxID=34613 RepID=A0A0K8R806_IXORI
MRNFVVAFALATFTFGFTTNALAVAEFLGNKGADTPNITIGYQFYGFNNSEFKEVPQWLNGLQREARRFLRRELGLKLKLQLAYIARPIKDLESKIEDWKKATSTLSPFTILRYLKDFFDRRYNTDIVCLVTKEPLYYTKTSNSLGYAIHSTLCETEVPMLLTYNKNEVNETGYHFGLLIRESIKNFEFRDWWSKTFEGKKKYFDNCNRYILDTMKG